ncbi:MAG: mandelate racemase/muconate lactonizing enzyme family protein [Clostridia bacterium]|nr:mandelate racemase/muconate lactonizing enzyme family protein [Clostridia bacterium]
MKISEIKTFVVNGGFRPWTFVKIETDEGVVGWGDASDWEASFATCKVIDFLKPFLIGLDPFNIEAIFWQNVNKCNRSVGGIAWKAIAGIDTALYDIKGKVLGVPVWQLLGGKIRDRLRLYWTHCGTGRNLLADRGLSEGRPAIRSLDDLRGFAAEVRQSGYTALKTNIMTLSGIAGGMPAGSPEKAKITSGMISRQELKTIESVIATFRDICGPEMEIALDTGFTYRLGGAIRLARSLEPYDMMWLEAESFDPGALQVVRQSTRTPIVHGESIYGVHGYRPYLERYAQDVLMIDLAWNGLTMGKKIADLAAAYDVPVSPHNCHSPLTTFVAASLCAATANFFILETDVEDVPWRDDIITEPADIRNGYLMVSDKPGLGTELVEDALIRYAWPAG